MHITKRMHTIRANTDYIHQSVHFKRRAYDKQYEVVGRLSDKSIDDLDLSIGGEIVLDVQPNRTTALASVRFFRYQQEV
ncbi:hypothetical protein [Maritalea mediterranea]|uniref:Uncharacterized protein n=1 Tax=Maritalea mediterranea TaxID=2909667 RepID=A0ABS9EDH3_9HYPH|nr:hypothetical protein [Maritalea mediterranea]MCF4099810.1 hypothetical protein [Maritalea mediterranea]